MSKLEIIYRPVADLRVNPANARKHSQKQVEKIAASIQSFGFNVPLLTNGEDQLVAGHGRFAAARPGWPGPRGWPARPACATSSCR